MKYLAMTSTFASESRVGSPNGWCGNRALPARSQRGLAVQERFSPALRVPPPRHAASAREAALGLEDLVVVLAVVRAGRLCLLGAGCPEDRPGRGGRLGAARAGSGPWRAPREGGGAPPGGTKGSGSHWGQRPQQGPSSGGERYGASREAAAEAASPGLHSEGGGPVSGIHVL